MKCRDLLPSMLLLITYASGISGSAYAIPVGVPGDGAAERLPPAQAELGLDDVDFAGTVALANCSGSLIRFAGAKPTDKALVLTNGHCYEGGFLPTNKVLYNQTSSRLFSLLGPSGASVGILRAAQIAYATMTGTDVLLYRLTQTYEDIKALYGIDALTLASEHPQIGAPIRIVSGYWKKIYKCNIDAFVHELHEHQEDSTYNWVWNDSIRYTQPGCETIGGTSGAPIVHADTKEVIGINNTSNDAGQRCTLNNPCEVDESGRVFVRRDAKYGQETYLIYGCLDADNNIDLDQADCRLARPAPH